MGDLDITVYSLNCNGLRDKTKRTAVFHKLRKTGMGLYLLQETHSTEDVEFSWQVQWGSRNVYFSYGSSNSRGVATLIPENSDITVHSISRDDCGRFIILDAEKDGHKFSVGNVYFPTRDKESEQRETLLKFIEALMSFNNEHIIIAGDWNLYLNPRLDKLDDMGESSDNGSYR